MMGAWVLPSPEPDLEPPMSIFEEHETSCSSCVVCGERKTTRAGFGFHPGPNCTCCFAQMGTCSINPNHNHWGASEKWPQNF